MKYQNPKELKPNKNEIAHIKTLNENDMIVQWSVYLLDGTYYLSKGMLFHEKQNHEVLMSDKKYLNISDYLLSQHKS